MKTPLPYYGGKQRIASKIVERMPGHTCYVEPFFGGGAVLFRKGYPSVTNADNYREVINDRDQELVGFWRALRDDPDLLRQLQALPYSKAIYDEAVSLKGTAKDKPWAKYVRICQAFANIECNGWVRNKPRARGDEKNAPASWMNRTAIHLPAASERLQGAYIECSGALGVIKQWDTPYTLHYCDPPYPGAAQGHYSGYTLKDLQDLVDCLAECKGSIMLSNYDQPGLTVPDDWARVEFSAFSSASLGSSRSSGARTEVLWIKDRSSSCPNQEILWTPAKSGLKPLRSPSAFATLES